MRFKTHHEGADYDNPEEVIVFDEETRRELVIRPRDDGFQWEIHEEGLNGSTFGVIPDK